MCIILLEVHFFVNIDITFFKKFMFCAKNNIAKKVIATLPHHCELQENFLRFRK